MIININPITKLEIDKNIQTIISKSNQDYTDSESELCQHNISK